MMPRDALLTGVLAAGAAHALPGAAAVLPALRRPLGIDSTTASGEGVALTFDDGPHPRGTPAILEELARHGVRATFFLVGEQVDRDPALAAEVAAAGHAIAVHCDRHRNLLRLSPGTVRNDLNRAAERIGAATGAPLSLYRPPYGVFSGAALREARRRDWRPLLWTAWGRDWEARATPDSITRSVTHGLGAGSVLLLHDADDYSSRGSWRRTLAALPRVIEAIAAAGLEVVDP